MSQETTETTETTMRVPALEDSVADYEHLFDLPVAVQLRVPVVAMDAAAHRETLRDGEYFVWNKLERENGGAPVGLPEISYERDDKGVVVDPSGQPRPSIRQIYAGKLAPSPSGRQIVLTYRTDKGAYAAAMLRPELIDCVTLIPTVPKDMRLEPQESRDLQRAGERSSIIRPA